MVQAILRDRADLRGSVVNPQALHEVRLIVVLMVVELLNGIEPEVVPERIG